MPQTMSDSDYHLGVTQMDDTHDEFIALVDSLTQADRPDFAGLFLALVAHTRSHFESENALMRASGFAAIREHMDEHLRVLGDLDRLAQRVRDGSIAMARAYVREQLPEWFSVHLATMDSALAAHLQQDSQMPVYASATLH